MIGIQRLNMDSSWYFNWDNSRFILDPWLVGSEIDGFKWLNQQWHTTPPIELNDIPTYDFILISQSYEDHCHLETLRLIDPSVPIVATKKPYLKLKKKLGERNLYLIPEATKTEPLKFGGLKFWALRPKRIMDPIYYALLIINSRDEAIFYSPHGFDLTPQLKKSINYLNYELLLTTLIDFRIPQIMGGHVNPGLPNARAIQQTLNPKFIFNTHDEDKKARGLVARLAKVTYPDYDQIKRLEGFNLVDSDNYKMINFE